MQEGLVQASCLLVADGQPVRVQASPATATTLTIPPAAGVCADAADALGGPGRPECEPACTWRHARGWNVLHQLHLTQAEGCLEAAVVRCIFLSIRVSLLLACWNAGVCGRLHQAG